MDSRTATRGRWLYGGCVTRVVAWFSCGAASAVAAKLAIQKYGEAGDVDILGRRARGYLLRAVWSAVGGPHAGADLRLRCGDGSLQQTPRQMHGEGGGGVILEAFVLVVGSGVLVLACHHLQGWRLKVMERIQGDGSISRISRWVFWVPVPKPGKGLINSGTR